MASKKSKICRLCIKLVSATNYDAIEEIRMDMLEVLLINMDFNISKEPIVCNACVETLHNCFDFKSVCFYVEDYIMPFMENDVKVDISKVFHKRMKISEEMKLEMYQICRLCMELIENDSYKSIESEISVMDMMQKCLPELNLTSTYDPLICDMCLSSLQYYSKFMKTCLDVEEKIKEYHKNNAKISNDTVDLHEVLQFTIKMKKLNQNNSIVENFETEDETRHIEYEDSSFKLESDPMNVKSPEKASHLSKDDKNNLEKGNVSVNLKKKINFKENCIYPCTKCSYRSNFASSCEAHFLRSHHDPPIFMCDLCGYRTDEKSNLNSHLSEHRGATKPFGCRKCEFETNFKRCYLSHQILHAGPKDLTIYKCEFCSFESKHKLSVVGHTKVKHDENITWYKCEECNFQSQHKGSLKYHMTLHKNPGVIPMHQCPHCKFKSKTKSNLRQHLLIHDNSEESKNCKCPKCPYRTWSTSALKRHMPIHLDFDQTAKYSCSQCMYVSKLKENLIRHMKTHQELGERKLFKCSICDYKAKTKISVTHHMLSHKDPSEITMYKCDECCYQTKIKNKLKSHKLKHKSKDQLETFKCMHCPYEGKKKTDLSNHVKIHMRPDQLEMFKCHQCSYKAKRKNDLYVHIKTIHNAQTLPLFKCELCEYKSIWKSNLKHHKLIHLEASETTMYKCIKCKFETKYKYNLNAHTKTCKKRKGRK